MAEPAAKLNAVSPEEDSPEGSFRYHLEGVIEILERLAPHFDKVEDLHESLKLALDNDGHLRFLMGKVLKRKR